MLRLLLAATLLAPLSALAGTETDVATLERCLGPIGAEGNRDQRDCLGAVSEPCQAALADPTAFDRADCVLREHNGWEALRDRYYEDLHGTASDVARTTLREAERHWAEYRHWDCAALDLLTADQSGDDMMSRHLAISVCLRDYMAERALRLRRLLARSR